MIYPPIIIPRTAHKVFVWIHKGVNEHNWFYDTDTNTWYIKNLKNNTVAYGDCVIKYNQETDKMELHMSWRLKTSKKINGDNHKFIISTCNILKGYTIKMPMEYQQTLKIAHTFSRSIKFFDTPDFLNREMEHKRRNNVIIN
jgi:hypothetical protein